MSDEEWLPIPGYAGYEVSDVGRVRSVDRWVHHHTGRKQFRKGMIRRSHPHPNSGHLLIKLRKDNSVASCRVHMLVMLAFVGPCPEGMEVCHDNGIPDDNRLANLRYDTKSANRLDSVRHGTHNMASKTHCKRGHLFDEANTVTGRPNGWRQCATCRLVNQRAARARRRTLAA